MKKTMLMLVAGVVASCTYAQKMQDKSVPVAVKNAFQQKYPSAKEVKWEKENGNFEANFDLDEADNSVLIDAQGNILETEVEIVADKLPAAALDFVKTRYPGKKVKEAAMITKANGTVTFEAEIKGKDLIFDSSGKFLNESKD